jgi:cation:H+ antiporter
MLADMAREAYRRRVPIPEEVQEADPTSRSGGSCCPSPRAFVGLPLGADLLVDGAVGIATRLGVSEAVIGLTLVAVGTSLPELATTVMAALRSRDRRRIRQRDRLESSSTSCSSSG